MGEHGRDAPRAGAADRRRYPRLQADAFVRPTSIFARGPARRVNDLSVGGLRVYSDDEHRPGDRLEFELALPRGEAVEFIGQVVWVETLPPGGPARFDVGIEFVEVPPGNLERIARVLAGERE
jgi:hypothetical protein